MEKKFYTSESVTEGHPDKMADQISDAILDAILERDPFGRVAVETLLTNGLCVIAGEVTTDAYIDIPRVARGVIKNIGYTDARFGFDYATCGVVTAIQEQSPDIALGVSAYKKERPEEVGAGDQGLMYGYAVRETPELMPLAITLAHRLTRRLARVRKNGTLSWLRPDGKSQVTIEYDGRKPKRIETVLISTQHAPEKEQKQIVAAIKKYVIAPVIPKRLVDSKTKILINPTGRFVIGGPKGDTGLTGRKIIVDTYGGRAPHGGGAFSGKDPTKVDRSAAYAARWVAKNIVAAGLADEAEVKIAYAIGVAEPLAININTFGTGTVSDENLMTAVRSIFDLRPGMLMKVLDLRRPRYQSIAAYGHFGRPELDLPWEKTNKTAALKRALAH